MLEWGVWREKNGGTFVKNPFEIVAVFELLVRWLLLANVFEDYFSKLLPHLGVFSQQPECP